MYELLTLALHFHALVIYTCFKEWGERKLTLQNPFRNLKVTIFIPGPHSKGYNLLSKFLASFS
jgi:hypothetical protein